MEDAVNDGQQVYLQWQNTLRQQVSEPAWNGTLGVTRFVDYSNGVLSIGVPSEVQLNQIKARHLPVMNEALRSIAGDAAVLRVDVDATFVATPREAEVSFVSAAAPDVIDVVATTPSRAREGGVDPRMTFDTFVTGQSNRLAHAGAQSSAERPGMNYNPLFIYGRSGLGKTHLLHAIGNYVRTHFPTKNVLYVTTETFLNDFIRSVRESNTLALHERYRSVDVLLIDDIQFMSARGESFHENVFHTFNDLQAQGKQIVMSSDQSPRDMDKLQERLRSRILQGLIVEVGSPDLETRIAILQSKAEREGVAVPAEVVEYIANRVRDSIRELEGSITMLRAHSQLLEQDITLEFAKKHLGNLGREHTVLQVSHVVDAVAARYQVGALELRGPKRHRHLAHARHVAMYLIRELLPKYSYPMIGKEFGDRDHSTVINGVERIKKDLLVDPQLSEDVQELHRQLSQGEY